MGKRRSLYIGQGYLPAERYRYYEDPEGVPRTYTGILTTLSVEQSVTSHMVEDYFTLVHQ